MLHTNDTHSQIDPILENDKTYAGKGGVARRATLVKRIRKENPNTLLIDGGDVCQGTPYFNFYKGEVEYKAMSMIGYDVGTLGNHDFDNGVQALAERFPAGQGVALDLAEGMLHHARPRGGAAHFVCGDAEHLPVPDQAFDVVTNIESSHTYPNLRAFFVEVRRALKPNGMFLYTDLLPVQRWAEVRVLLASLRFKLQEERHITPNVLASCDVVAATRAQAFGAADAAIDNFLAVPGSTVYEQMHSGAWEYRIVRARRT